MFALQVDMLCIDPSFSPGYRFVDLLHEKKALQDHLLLVSDGGSCTSALSHNCVLWQAGRLGSKRNGRVYQYELLVTNYGVQITYCN